MKRNLSDDIAEGIDKSIFGEVLKIVLFSAVVVCIVFFLFFVISLFLPDKEPLPAAYSSCGSLDEVYCEIIIGEVGTESFNQRLNSFEICGWQEANEKLKYYKEIAQRDIPDAINKTGKYYEIKEAYCR